MLRPACRGEEGNRQLSVYSQPIDANARASCTAVVRPAIASRRLIAPEILPNPESFVHTEFETSGDHSDRTPEVIKMSTLSVLVNPNEKPKPIGNRLKISCQLGH